MLDRFTHTNSKGEVLDFVDYGIYINYNNLRDYEWSVLTSDYGVITGFNKGVVNKKLPLQFCVKEQEADTIKNAFYEHFDYDVLTNKPGYFSINGYRFYCFITKSAKTHYLKSKSVLNIDLQITSDKPYWVKEHIRSIDFSNLQAETKSLKYTFKYPFTYGTLTTVMINNEHFAESDAIIRIYGETANPLVTIGNNVYQINTTLKAGEYLEINTANKTIFKYLNYGEKLNIFDSRNKKYDVFKKIPSGSSLTGSNGLFKADIIIEERRGEPKWNSSTQTETKLNSGTYEMPR